MEELLEALIEDVKSAEKTSREGWLGIKEENRLVALTNYIERLRLLTGLLEQLGGLQRQMRDWKETEAFREKLNKGEINVKELLHG